MLAFSKRLYSYFEKGPKASFSLENKRFPVIYGDARKAAACFRRPVLYPIELRTREKAIGCQLSAISQQLTVISQYSHAFYKMMFHECWLKANS